MKKNRNNNSVELDLCLTTPLNDEQHQNTAAHFETVNSKGQLNSMKQTGYFDSLLNNSTHILITFMAAIALLLSVEASAQNACQTQMFNIGYTYGTRGFSCSFEKYGTLNDSYYRNHQVYLRAGNYYEICAVCDNDCEDLDIKLYDGFGNLVAEDESTDDFPMVFCNVISSGYFTIKVIMADCSNEPCSYGVAAFVK